MSDSESRRLRIVDQDRIDESTRADPGGAGGAPCLVAITTIVSTYPTSASAYYGVTAEAVLGTETEGSSGSYTVFGGVHYALNLGSTIPPAGTNVIITFVNSGRWVFRYDGPP